MGAYLDKPITAKESEDGELGCFTFGSSGMQGWRTGMEDSHVNILSFDGDPGAALFAVFDGHGGAEVAQFCKRRIAEALPTTQQFQDCAYADALRRTFLLLDEMILADWPKSLQQCAKDGGAGHRSMLESFGASPYSEGGAGCTAVSCFIKDGKLHVANAGDSRIVLCRAGKALELSEDHKPELDSERSRIIKANGYVSDGRVNGNLNLTRAIGDFAYKKDKQRPPEEQIITAYPDISSQDLVAADEFLILGCDGVWDRKTSQEVVDFVKPRIDNRAEGVKLSTIVEELLDALIAPSVDAFDGLGCDNMSCVIVDLVSDKRRDGLPIGEGVAAPEADEEPRVANPKFSAGNRRPTTVFGQEDEAKEAKDGYNTEASEPKDVAPTE